MDRGTLVIVAVTGILAVISGWIIPILFKSRRPWGVRGDILVCLIPAVVLSYVEWIWLLPAIGFSRQGWISIAAAIGDPLALGWICLWVLRKVKS